MCVVQEALSQRLAFLILTHIPLAWVVLSLVDLSLLQELVTLPTWSPWGRENREATLPVPPPLYPEVGPGPQVTDLPPSLFPLSLLRGGFQRGEYDLSPATGTHQIRIPISALPLIPGLIQEIQVASKSQLLCRHVEVMTEL